MTRETHHNSQSQPSHMLGGNARPHSPPEGAAVPSAIRHYVRFATLASQKSFRLCVISDAHTSGCASFDVAPAFQTFASENHRGIGSRNANAISASARRASVNIFMLGWAGVVSCVHLTRSYPPSSGKSNAGCCRALRKSAAAGSASRGKRCFQSKQPRNWRHEPRCRFAPLRLSCRGSFRCQANR